MRGSVLIAYEEGKQSFGQPLYEIQINGTDTRDYQWSEANSLYSTYIFSGNTLAVAVRSYGYGEIPYINIFLIEYTNDSVNGDNGTKTTQLTGVTGNNVDGILTLINLPINPSANCYDFIVLVSMGVTQGCAPIGILSGITGSGVIFTTTSEVKTKNVGVLTQDVGDIYVGVSSTFTTSSYSGATASGLIGPVIRLNPTYQLDPGFSSRNILSNNTLVNDIEIQNNGMILVGSGISTGFTGNSLSRLTTTGALDPSFTRYTFLTPAGASELVTDVVQQSDGKIIVSGNFEEISGLTYNRYARFNYDGTIDNTYYSGGTSTGFDGGGVMNCEIDVRNNKVYYFGLLTSTFNGSQFGAILRLNTNGQLDTTFNGTGRGGFSRVGASCVVNSVKVLSNGKILCIGGFTSYNGQYVRGVAMLNEDGTLDTTFNSGGYGWLNQGILYIAFPTENVDADENTYLIVGSWTGSSYNEVAIPNGIFFINKDGSLGNNTNLGTGLVGLAKTAKLLPNGSYLITGNITSFNGTPITNKGFVQISSTGQLQNC